MCKSSDVALYLLIFAVQRRQFHNRNGRIKAITAALTAEIIIVFHVRE